MSGASAVMQLYWWRDGVLEAVRVLGCCRCLFCCIACKGSASKPGAVWARMQ